MITGEYIIEFVGIDSKGIEIAKGNSVISNVELNDAYDFYSTAINRRLPEQESLNILHPN